MKRDSIAKECIRFTHVHLVFYFGNKIFYYVAVLSCNFILTSSANLHLNTLPPAQHTLFKLLCLISNIQPGKMPFDDGSYSIIFGRN